MTTTKKTHATPRQPRRPRLKPGRGPKAYQILIALGLAVGTSVLAYSRLQPAPDDDQEAKIENCITKGKQQRDGFFWRATQEILYDTRQQIAAEINDDSVSVSFPSKPEVTTNIFGLIKNTDQDVDIYTVCIGKGDSCDGAGLERKTVHTERVLYDIDHKTTADTIIPVRSLSRNPLWKAVYDNIKACVG